MVKPPKIRHSKVRKDPVTIDLDAAEVRRMEEESRETPQREAPEATAPEADETVRPNAADEALADSHGPAAEDQVPPAVEDPALTEAAAAAAEESPVARNPSYFGRTDRDPGAAPRERRSGRAMTALLGGAAGAVLALLGAAALQSAGVLPSPGADPAIDSASLDVLRADIDALRRQVSEPNGAADPALAEAVNQSTSRAEALSAELQELRGQIAALGEGQPTPLGDPEVQALEARIAQLEQAAGAAGDNQAALQELSTRLDELNAGQLSSTDVDAEQSARLDALEQRLAETSEQVEAQAAEPGMALAVAATALKSAIDRGTPFMMELETYAAIAPDMPQIAELREMAARGVPTRSEIEAEAADAASRMIAAAAAPADPSAGFLDRLYSSARSLVEVRPVGQVEGEGPAATVARMEVALREGDYAAAVEEYQSLPEASQAAGRDFIDKVRARLAADRLVAEALSGAVSAPANEG